MSSVRTVRERHSVHSTTSVAKRDHQQQRTTGSVLCWFPARSGEHRREQRGEQSKRQPKHQPEHQQRQHCDYGHAGGQHIDQYDHQHRYHQQWNHVYNIQTARYHEFHVDDYIHYDEHVQSDGHLYRFKQHVVGNNKLDVEHDFDDIHEREYDIHDIVY